MLKKLLTFIGIVFLVFCIGGYGFFLYCMDAMQHGCSGKHIWEKQ